MKSSREPESMTSGQRRREVAAILAQGLLRYRRRAGLGMPAASSEIHPEAQNCLELPGESRLHVADGSAG